MAVYKTFKQCAAPLTPRCSVHCDRYGRVNGAHVTQQKRGEWERGGGVSLVSASRRVREQSINSRKITHIGIAVKRRAMATVAFPGDTSSSSSSWERRVKEE